MSIIASCNNGTNISISVPKVAFEAGKANYHLSIKFTDDTGYYKISFNVPYSGIAMPTGKIVSNNLRCYNDVYAQTRIRGSIGVYEIKGVGGISLDSIDYTTTYTSYNYTQGLKDASIVASINNANIVNASVEIEADFPLFMENPTTNNVDTSLDPATYITYANTNYDTYGGEIIGGDYTHINHAENYYSLTNEISAYKVWSARTHLKKNGSVVGGTSKAYDFRILPDAKIAFYITDRINGDGSANAILQISESPWLQKPCSSPDSAYAETISLDSNYWDGDWQDYDTGDSYVGWFSTNIPCFRTAEAVQDYFDGKIGIDQAINGGDTTFHISSIGDDLSSTDIPTVNLATSGAGCFIYDLSVSDVKEIMSNYLYTDDASLKAEYVDALWMWGNNPIDFFIDLYYIPFSITNFYDTVAANLKFGTYQIPDTSYDAVKEANGDRIGLFSTSFEGIYGDWRDYTLFTYELYLPYVGFIELDPQKYVNHMVSCEMMFDITTHNLRYFIFSDGIISDRVDGSVGVNIPLMATDQVNKAKHDRNLKYGAVSGVIGGATSLVVGAAAESTGAGLGGITSGVNSMIGAIKQLEELNTKATQSVEGSFSSAMNIYDINYAYLKITEKGTLIPDKLHTLYGYPCYYMGKASALSGYCELSDIRLSGFTGTKDEANTLKNILREGVIL